MTRVLSALALLALAAPLGCWQSEATNARAADTPEQALLCLHKVPAALCTKCHPELSAVFRSQGDWCDEHGVPESQCLQCHPQLDFRSAPPADWCEEHALPESQCTKCHPALIAKFLEAGDYCRAHGYPMSVCPICHPDLPKAAGHEPPLFPAPGTKVTLASAQTVRDVGIVTARVQRKPWSQTIEVSGQLDFDGNAYAQLSTRGDARVLDVLVDVGDAVKAGQGLVVLASAEAGADRAMLTAAKVRLEAANSALQRLGQLEGITAKQNIDEARREQADAQATHDAALAGLRASGADLAAAGDRLVLTSPIAGTVVGRDVVAGRVADADDVLLEVADTRTLWATLEVPELSSLLVKPGQAVQLRFDGLSLLRDGVIAKVGARIDARTRTVRARVNIDNKDSSLKAGLFFVAAITVAEAKEALLVPESAVQRVQGRALVFVDKGKGVYLPVAVELGRASGDLVEVTAGLNPGDQVVTVGAFLLKTEILRDSIGAGCCDDD